MDVRRPLAFTCFPGARGALPNYSDTASLPTRPEKSAMKTREGFISSGKPRLDGGFHAVSISTDIGDLFVSQTGGRVNGNMAVLVF